MEAPSGWWNDTKNIDHRLFLFYFIQPVSINKKGQFAVYTLYQDQPLKIQVWSFERHMTKPLLVTKPLLEGAAAGVNASLA